MVLQCCGVGLMYCKVREWTLSYCRVGNWTQHPAKCGTGLRLLKSGGLGFGYCRMAEWTSCIAEWRRNDFNILKSCVWCLAYCRVTD
jgi:hypothetical protein